MTHNFKDAHVVRHKLTGLLFNPNVGGKCSNKTPKIYRTNNDILSQGYSVTMTTLNKKVLAILNALIPEAKEIPPIHSWYKKSYQLADGQILSTGHYGEEISIEAKPEHFERVPVELKIEINGI